MADVEIGMGRWGRQTYSLDEIAIVPSRRTRTSSEVSTAWQIDAYRFELPLLNHPTDAIASPAVLTQIGQLGGLAVLNAEGLWGRYADPEAALARILEQAREDEPEGILDGSVERLQELYSTPVDNDLLTQVIVDLKRSGSTLSVRVSPQRAAALTPVMVAAGSDLLAPAPVA